MYIATNHAIKVPFCLQTRTKRVDRKALLDSGATESFIHHRTARRLNLKTKELKKPRDVRNVDGTLNRAGAITHAVEIEVAYNGHTSKHNFFIADIGPDEFLLGFPFFEATQPTINWKKGEIVGQVTLRMEDADRWQPAKRGSRKRVTCIPAWVHALDGWEEGDELWQKITIRKMTVAQQLAIQEADKQKKKDWHDIVPPQYHKYKIWSEEESE